MSDQHGPVQRFPQGKRPKPRFRKAAFPYVGADAGNPHGRQSPQSSKTAERDIDRIIHRGKVGKSCSAALRKVGALTHFIQRDKTERCSAEGWKQVKIAEQLELGGSCGSAEKTFAHAIASGGCDKIVRNLAKAEAQRLGKGARGKISEFGLQGLRSRRNNRKRRR